MYTKIINFPNLILLKVLKYKCLKSENKYRLPALWIQSEYDIINAFENYSYCLKRISTLKFEHFVKPDGIGAIWGKRMGVKLSSDISRTV